MAKRDSEKKDVGVEGGDNFYALVGWDAVGLGDRMVLKLQGVQAKSGGGEREVEMFEFFLNRDQALQLGNYLLEVSGNASRHRERSWLDRILER